MDLKEREKEVVEYSLKELEKVFCRVLFVAEIRAMNETIKAILRRYDLYDTEDMPRE